MGQQGLERACRGCRPSMNGPSSASGTPRIRMPTFAQLAEPTTIPDGIAGPAGRASSPDAPDPLNLFRVHWFNDADRRSRAAVPQHLVLPVVADRRPGADHRRARRPLPDDRRPQGPGRLRLPRAADRHRPVRPDRAARDLAVDRQLLPRRRGDQPDHGLPRRRRAARGDEPGAVRLARGLGHRPGRHHPDAGHREQRQGDLRQVRRARAGLGQRHPQPVRRVREPPRPLPRDRASARDHRRRAASPAPQARGRRVRVGDRIGRHDRRRATGSRTATARRSSRSRRSSARPCSRTASASTTSRASATSTSR